MDVVNLNSIGMAQVGHLQVARRSANRDVTKIFKADHLFLASVNFSVSPRLQKGGFHGGVLKEVDKVLWDVRASSRRVLVGIPHGELRVGLLCHQEDSAEDVLNRQRALVVKSAVDVDMTFAVAGDGL